MSEDEGKKQRQICGIVMPISALDGCSESHWAEVHDILNDAIEDAGFDSNLVSNADDVGIIQKRIIQNLYDNPVVVCDVSGKNPNVMFELGMRLAFDRPTIIIKDDKTSYSFDTSPIEHLEYPRDLRFTKIVEFKEVLSDKIRKTYERSTSDPGYTTFLKHFGEFKIAKIDKKEVSGQEFIIEELRTLRTEMEKLATGRPSINPQPIPQEGVLEFCLSALSVPEIGKLLATPFSVPISKLELFDFHDHKHLHIKPQTKSDKDALIAEIRDISPAARLKMRLRKKTISAAAPKIAKIDF